MYVYIYIYDRLPFMKAPQMPNQTYPQENDPRDLPARDPTAFRTYFMLPST